MVKAREGQAPAVEEEMALGFQVMEVAVEVVQEKEAEPQVVMEDAQEA